MAGMKEARGVGGKWGEMEGKDLSDQHLLQRQEKEREGCDACKEQKNHRNNANNSARRSLDYCSLKLLQNGDSLCSRVCLQSSEQAEEVPSGPVPLQGPPAQAKLLQTDHRPRPPTAPPPY